VRLLVTLREHAEHSDQVPGEYKSIGSQKVQHNAGKFKTRHVYNVSQQRVPR